MPTEIKTKFWASNDLYFTCCIKKSQKISLSDGNCLELRQTKIGHDFNEPEK
jgi:hypothetical protein